MAFTQAMFVYCSPAGTTRHVADVMMQQCRSLGVDVRDVDLAGDTDMEAVLGAIAGGGGDLCLFVGSPVYVSHALPPVMDFIQRLPAGTVIPAVPFVTWGGACSGMALFEMGEALENKGMMLAGGAKILALHSMMWRSDAPVGQGHPDAEDDRLVRDLVKNVHRQLRDGAETVLKSSDLAHYPKAVMAEMAKLSLAAAAAHMPPRSINEEACTECGQCAEVCPTDAITYSPYPVFGKACIYCYNCVRDCPEQAIEADMSMVAERIRERVQQFNEQPLSQIFYLA